jgi:hypothetical protein
MFHKDVYEKIILDWLYVKAWDSWGRLHCDNDHGWWSSKNINSAGQEPVILSRKPPFVYTYYCDCTVESWQ